MLSRVRVRRRWRARHTSIRSDLVPILVPERSRLASCTLHLCPRIRCPVSYRFDLLAYSIRSTHQLTDQTGNDTSDGRCDLEQMRDGLGIEQLVLYDQLGFYLASTARGWSLEQEWGRTGTLRWVMTTAVSLPRTATAVIPAPEIALKAYSTLSDGLTDHTEDVCNSPT